jgi:predicted O-linked N-acetylglucosamine transferase (SPINDLY family)
MPDLAQAQSFHRDGDLRAAAAAYRALLPPDALEALHGLGLLHLAQGDAAAALPLLQAAYRLAPDARKGHNLAVGLAQHGLRADATAQAREVVARFPDYVPARFGLAALLAVSGAGTEAAGVLIAFAEHAMRAGDVAAARDAVARLGALDTDHPALLWLANLLHMAGQAAAARSVLAIRLRRAPDDIGGLLTQAMACLTRVPAREAEAAQCRAAYAAGLDAAAAAVERAAPPALAAAAAVIGLAQPFLLSYHGRNNRDLQRRYGGIVARLAAAQGFPPAALPPPPRPGEKIRVGFASAHLHMHSVSKTHGGWISGLDRARFSVFGYQLSPFRDAVSARIEACCDRFVRGLANTAAWRSRILADAPHVLVYPDIGMEQTAVRLAALRLAPVQCTSWGHPDTSGLPTIDAYLSSAAMEPADGDAHYTETLVRLPGLGIAYTPPPDSGAVMPRAALGVRDDAVVYLCCQSLCKYLPRHDALWPRIAARVPAAQFLFLSAPGGDGDAVFRARLHASFAAAGLNWRRHCVLVPPVPHHDFPALLRAADVFLDSIGWSGCNSTLEAVACGLPVVTMPGALMRGRHSAAILAELGLSRRIAGDTAGYVEAAVQLADPAARAGFAAELRAAGPALVADTRAVRALEDFFTQAVRL